MNKRDTYYKETYKKLGNDIEKYVGKVVAWYKGKIIACGDTYKEVKKKVKDKKDKVIYEEILYPGELIINAKKYGGKQVAWYKGKIIACGDTLEEVFEKVEKKLGNKSNEARYGYINKPDEVIVV